MFWLIQRYILRDLAKTFLLATLALAVILTLGSLIRPIQRYGIGPAQVANLVIYLTPVTITLVLPVAALFAASLVYGRLATDNEYDACKASGIGPLTIISPGLMMAGAVAVGTLLLALHVMPQFVQMADRSINADLRPILFRHLQRLGYYRVGGPGGYTIYTDYADPKTGRLFGVVVVQEGQEGIKQVMGAEVAQVVFERQDQLTKVRILTSGPFQLDLTGGSQVKASTLSVGLLIEPWLADRIKFKRIGQIKQIQANPLLYRPVARLAKEVWSQALIEMQAHAIQQALETGLAYTLTGQELTCRLKGSQATIGRGTIAIEGPIQLQLGGKDPADGHTTWRARRATLSLNLDGPVPCLALGLVDPRSEDGMGPMSGPQIPPLDVPRSIIDTIGHQPTLTDLLAGKVTAKVGNPSPYLTSQLDRLSGSIRSLQAEIAAELHSRLAFGIGCIPMIIIGIGLGIIRRGGHLLTAFAISCLPALLLVVMIIGGKELARNPTGPYWLGLAVIWSGVAALAVLAGWVWLRLPR